MFGDIDVECTRESGTLYIDDVEMHRQVFCAMDVTPLWWGALQRGTDVQIPTMTGALPMPRRWAATTYSIPMLIDGGWDINDARQPNYSQGQLDVIRWLESNVTGPAASDDGTRTVVLVSPDRESSYSAEAHVKMTAGARTARYIRAIIEISVPGGQLILDDTLYAP